MNHQLGQFDTKIIETEARVSKSGLGYILARVEGGHPAMAFGRGYVIRAREQIPDPLVGMRCRINVKKIRDGEDPDVTHYYSEFVQWL